MQLLIRDPTNYETMKRILLSTYITCMFTFGAMAQVYQNAPSLWLGPKNSPQADIMMQDLMIPKDTNAVSTYYSTLNWNSGADGGGYCGLQNSSDGGNKTIFSLWDPASGDTAKLAYAGPGVTFSRFGGEGTGWHAEKNNMWTESQWYTLFTRRWDVGTHTYFGYWIQSQTDNTWTHYLTFDYPVAGIYFNSGNSGSGFIEDWAGTGQNMRKVYFTNGYKRSTASGTPWVPFSPYSFSFTQPNLTTNPNGGKWNAGVKGNTIYLQTGGNTTPAKVSGQSYTWTVNIPAKPAKPAIQFSIASADNYNLYWTVPASSTPQFKYTITINGAASAAVTEPEARYVAINAPKGAKIDLTLEDIIGNTTTQSITLPSDNVSPQVAVTAPANNTSINTFSSVTITATASDADGTVAKVEFYANGTMLGEDASNPYAFTWANVPTGSYAIVAKAIDNKGAITSSVAVNITASNPCNLAGTAFGTSPAYQNGTSTFDKVYDGSIATYFDYSQAGGGYAGLDLGTTKVITGVRYYPRSGNGSRMSGGKFQGSNTANFSTGVVDLYTITDSPSDAWYEIAVSNLTSFRYVRYLSPANGYCNVAEVEFCGYVANSNNAAPSVSITSPVNNTAYTSPATVAITANATDTDGSIAKVEFYNGTTKLGEDYTSPFAYTWAGAASGTYNLTAQAMDNAGAVTTSAVVKIIVSTTTDIADLQLAEGTVISPNPTTGPINFSLPVDALAIYDLTGKLISSEQKAGILHYDLTAFKSGIYILQLQTGVQNVFHKIIKE